MTQSVIKCISTAHRNPVSILLSAASNRNAWPAHESPRRARMDRGFGNENEASQSDTYSGGPALG